MQGNGRRRLLQGAGGQCWHLAADLGDGRGRARGAVAAAEVISVCDGRQPPGGRVEGKEMEREGQWRRRGV